MRWQRQKRSFVALLNSIRVQPVFLVPDLDIFERDVRGSRGPYTRALHLCGRDARASFDEEQGHSCGTGTTGAHRHGEIIGEHTIGDPFLLTVDDVVLAVGGFLRRRLQVRHIGTGRGLRDGKADHLGRTGTNK